MQLESQTRQGQSFVFFGDHKPLKQTLMGSQGVAAVMQELMTGKLNDGVSDDSGVHRCIYQIQNMTTNLLHFPFW